MRGRWLTPALPSAGSQYRLIRLPAAVDWQAPFWGALDDLRFSSNWQQLSGIAADDAAESFAALFDEWRMPNPLIGSLFPFISDTLPANALACSGQTLLRADYPDLYAKLDPAWVVDADHFKLPDCRARAVIGSSAAAPGGLTPRAMGATGGEENHTLSIFEMPDHNHFYNAPLPAVPTAAVGVTPAVPGFTPGTATSITGGGGTHNNMMPYIAIRWAIWAK